jgi:hypothetical protein
MLKEILIVVLVFIVAGCMHYPSQDYIEYHGVDYGYVFGSKQKIYSRDYGRVTSIDDRYIQFSIGAKTLKNYNNDRNLVSDLITKDIFSKERFCSNGYEILYTPGSLTGDYGFMWTVVCK